MIVCNNKNIGEVFYLNKSYSEVYKGDVLIFKKQEEDINKENYDLILEWKNRTCNPDAQSGNDQNNLVVKINNTNIKLIDYLEEDPSTISKCNYSDIVNGEVTNLYRMFTPVYSYLSSTSYPPIPIYLSNDNIINIKRLVIPPTVTSVSEMFYIVSALSSINAEWDLSGLTSAISSSFCRKISLEFRGTIKNLSVNADIRNWIMDNKGVMVWINGLSEVSSSHTLTINTDTYNTLTEDQKQIASDKGWTIASAS